MSIQKPVMRNLHVAAIKKQLVILIGVSVAVTAAYKFLVIEPKKRKYDNFYKTYDPEEHLQQMKAAGLLESQQP